MAGKGQRQVVGRHAATVVADPDQLHTTGLHLDIHAGGPGVETVLEHLLDHRSRAFHHLAGGDLVGQTGRQELDGGHGRIGIRLQEW